MKKAFSVQMILVLQLVFIATLPLRAAQTIVLNFEPRDKAIYTHFDDSADFAAIRRWAQNRGLTLLPDKLPVADKRAFFVSRYGSSTTVAGLNPNSAYTLYIDFVSFERGGGNGGIVSRLVISCDGEKLAELNFGAQGSEPYAVAVPRNCSLDGTVTIRFEEFATTNGVWGIWDMILSDGPLPQTVDYKAEVAPIKDSSGDAPDARGGNKDKPVKKTGVKEPTGKPAPKLDKEPKDVVEPTTKPVEETKSPDATKAEPPKVPGAPAVKDVDIRDGRGDQ
jgi:hypothetical protein